MLRRPAFRYGPLHQLSPILLAKLPSLVKLLLIEETAQTRRAPAPVSPAPGGAR